MLTGFTSSNPLPARRGVSRRSLIVGGVVIAATAAALFGTDLAVGYYQNRLIEQRKERQKKLQRMAWYELRADIDDVSYTPDGKYRVRMWLDNVFPEHDFYVMAPAIRVFVQIGPRWVEVPAREASDEPLSEGTVVNLKQKTYAGRVFEIPHSDYFELLPGYMHVKFDHTMFVSPDAQPKEDLIERTDNYYIYLRPINADDERLRKLNQFPGPVPLWIGMPPH